MDANFENATSEVRALDHYILQVHDLDAAGRNYEKLGFTVLPRMQHIELGTSNRVAQFKNTYLEILGDFEGVNTSVMDEYLPRFECGEGLVHVALRSYDMPGDNAKAAEQGLNPMPIMNARREIVMPDGTVQETDSHSFYIWRKERLYLSIFLSDHYKPETIWVPEFQQHANTAIDAISVVFVSDDPQLDLEYFSTLYRTGPIINTKDELRFIGSRGDTAEIFSRSRIRDRYPDLSLDICEKQPGYPVGLTYLVESLDQCRAVLEQNEVRHFAEANRLIVGADDACGAILEFVQQ